MSDDLHTLLADADGGPAGAVDVDAIVDRGDRLRRRRTAGRVASVVAVAVLVGSTAGVALHEASGPSLAPVGEQPGGPAPSDGGFHPSSFADEDDEPTDVAWYMTRGGFESRVDDPEAMCEWARRTGDRMQHQLRPYGGDGLPLVVAEFCGLVRPGSEGVVYSEPQVVLGDTDDCSWYAREAWEAFEVNQQYPPEGGAPEVPHKGSTLACLKPSQTQPPAPDQRQRPDWAYPDDLHTLLATASEDTPPMEIDDFGLIRVDVSDPAVCEWIVPAVGGTDQLGDVARQPTDGAEFVQPNHKAITDRLESTVTRWGDGTIWALANLCHPDGNPDLNETTPDGVPDEPHVSSTTMPDTSG